MYAEANSSRKGAKAQKIYRTDYLVRAFRWICWFLKYGVWDVDVKFHVNDAHCDVAICNVARRDLNATMTPSTLR